MTKRSLALVALVAALAVSVGFAARPLFGTARDTGVAAAATPTAIDVANTRSVTVAGQGQIKIKPDLAYAIFAVETSNADLTVAQSENTTRMNAVLEKLKSLGIAEKDLQTTGYNVYPQYNKQDGKPNGYTVNNTVRATVRDITRRSSAARLTRRSARVPTGSPGSASTWPIRRRRCSRRARRRWPMRG